MSKAKKMKLLNTPTKDIRSSDTLLQTAAKLKRLETAKILMAAGAGILLLLAVRLCLNFGIFHQRSQLQR